MSTMSFTFNDGGRAAAGYRGSAGDCVARAVAIATGQPYQQVYDALSEGSRSQRLTKRSSPKASARDGVNVRRVWFKRYMTALGWVWTPTMHIGSGCTVHLTKGELPMGRLIVSVSKHYTCVLDGVIHDTHNPERNVHWCAPIPTSEPTKAGRAVRRSTSGGYEETWVERRCVYGYWSKATS